MTLFEIVPSLRHAGTPRVDRTIWPVTTHVDELGRLCVGEVALTDIADAFGTPTFVVDEADFRHRIRRYRAALPEARLVYPGKALLTTAIAQWVAEEGVGLGVCSGVELATALIAGVHPNQIVAHGTVTISGELTASNAGVGRIVVQSPSEVTFLAAGLRRPQGVQVRVSPDVDCAADVIQRVLDQPLLNLVGMQCHIGSQVTDASRYGEAIRQMVPLMAEIRARHGVILTELNIVGADGVPYSSGDSELDLEALRGFVEDSLDTSCAAERFPRPTVVVEPGSAICARAGVTLYRVLWVQSQAGGRTIVMADGGLGANPRVTLYDADCTEALAQRADLRAGDLLAVACTGAYHHGMASTYNLVGRPPVVAVKDGRSRELVRRETMADLLSRDRVYNEPPPMRRGHIESGCEAILHDK
jgi:diaminopimelate decarboxylase